MDYLAPAVTPVSQLCQSQDEDVDVEVSDYRARKSKGISFALKATRISKEELRYSVASIQAIPGKPGRWASGETRVKKPDISHPPILTSLRAAVY